MVLIVVVLMALLLIRIAAVLESIYLEYIDVTVYLDIHILCVLPIKIF